MHANVGSNYTETEQQMDSAVRRPECVLIKVGRLISEIGIDLCVFYLSKVRWIIFHKLAR